MANIVMAPDTIAVQPNIAAATTSGFTSSLLDRLGGARQLTSVSGITVSTGGDGAMGLGNADKARGPPTGPASRFTSFALGTLFGGNRGETFDLAGYEYDATAGTAGIEYSLSRNLIIGLAGNYTTTHADLTSGANIDLDAIQGAAYLSYATKHVFADQLVGVGSHDINLVRPGVIDPVRGETDAFTLAVAARGGYLFDFGKVRAGPIAGLTYMHTRVDGYTEKGDPMLTFDVSSQTLDTLTGHVGLRFLAPFRNGDSVIIPYLNILLEHQLGDDTRTLTASLTQAPLLPILSPVATFDARTYGKVEGGITFQLDPGLGATISGATTFARDDAFDFRIGAGLNLKF
jgi:outer membrane autotransporter protein